MVQFGSVLKHLNKCCFGCSQNMSFRFCAAQVFEHIHIGYFWSKSQFLYMQAYQDFIASCASFALNFVLVTI